MVSLYLKNNHLTGSFIARNLPREMSGLNASGNAFSAIAVVEADAKPFIDLQGSGVTSIIDENGREKLEGIRL